MVFLPSPNSNDGRSLEIHYTDEERSNWGREKYPTQKNFKPVTHFFFPIFAEATQVGYHAPKF